MSDVIQNKIIIENNYKNLINKNYYEAEIYEIMNLSKKVFPDKYKHIKNQSHGESDFINEVTGELIDAKTIFPTKQCEKLSLNQIKEFINDIVKETNEVFNVIMGKDINTICNTILYKGILNALKNIKKQENVIVFIPFAFTLEMEASLSSKLGSDMFTQIMRVMEKEMSDLFNNRIIYFIYPNIENKVIVKNYTRNICEYIDTDILSKYIKNIFF